MIGKRVCSFCRRSEAEVDKLVAGPRVYICDRCAAEAVRIMNESGPAATKAPGSDSHVVTFIKGVIGWWQTRTAAGH